MASSSSQDVSRGVGDMKLAGKVLCGLIERYKRAWGQHALTPRHHIPIQLNVVLDCAEALRAYALTGAGWSHALHDAMLACLCFCMVRGPRLDEWVEMRAGDSFYRRANFNWCDTA